MKQIINIIISSFLFIACNGKAQTVSDKAKDNNKVAQMLDAYQKQPHRIALNGCSFSYNEQPFQLGTTIKELVSILGDYDYFNLRYYVWKDIGIVCSAKSKIEDINNELTYIYIYMNTKGYEKYKNLIQQGNHKKDYFLINGIPHRYDIHFSDFINHSTYDLNKDFGASNHSYFITESCENDKRIKCIIDIDGGIWNYKGGGHLRLKNGLNQNNDNRIEYIGIGYVESEN